MQKLQLLFPSGKKRESNSKWIVFCDFVQQPVWFCFTTSVFPTEINPWTDAETILFPSGKKRESNSKSYYEDTSHYYYSDLLQLYEDTLYSDTVTWCFANVGRFAGSSRASITISAEEYQELRNSEEIWFRDFQLLPFFFPRKNNCGLLSMVFTYVSPTF